MKRALAAAIGAALVIAASPAPASVQPPAHPIQAAIEEYLGANMPWPAGTARVDFLSAEPDPKARAKGVTLRVEPAGNPEFIGDLTFLVRHFREGALIRTESVRARIEVLREVVTAARTLHSGTVLAEGDLRTVRRWVRRWPPQALSSPDEALGRRLTTLVRPGSEIVATMLKEAPLVRKGKMVRVVFDNGLLQIDTVGLMEEDGMAGEIVRVRNLNSKKTIYGRLLGDSLVAIELQGGP